MPRNGSGTFTKAVSNFVTGTTISATDVNTLVGDLADEMTNSVDKDGQTVYTGSHDWNGNYMVTDLDGDSKVGSPTDDQWDVYLSGSIKHKQTVSGYEFTNISNPTFLGNDTDGVLTFSPNTGVLGGIVKLYGDTHATKAGDIEFLVDATVIGSYDNSAGTWIFEDKQIQKALFLDYGEVANAIGSIGGGTQDIDLTLGNAVSATVDTSSTTFTFSNPSPTGNRCGFSLKLTNGGSQVVAWPASVNWVSGTQPTLTTAGVDWLAFVTDDAGTTWDGFVVGLDVK